MKKRILWVFLGGTTLLFAVMAGCGGNPGEKEYEKAMEAWARQDLVRAQSQLEKALRKLTGNEKKSVACNQLGIICWQLGKRDRAIESFGESCRLSGDLTGANLNLGSALYHNGQLNEARMELTKILNEQPGNTRARIYLGLVLMQLKDWQGAYTELNAALREEPNLAAGQNALALAELHLNRNTDTAVKRLKQLLAAYPDYAPAVFNLAVIDEQWNRDPAAALSRYRQYLEKAGEKEPQRAYAGKAVERLSRVGPDDPRGTEPSGSDPAAANRYIAEGSRLHAAKKYSEAVRQYQLAIQADPSRVNAHYNLALSHYELRQYREAVRACAEALKLDPGYTNARYMLALSYAQLKEWNNAEREAGRLKQNDPEKADTLLKYIQSQR